MHFLGASRDGLVARPVEMDKLSSSEWTLLFKVITYDWLNQKKVANNKSLSAHEGLRRMLDMWLKKDAQTQLDNAINLFAKKKNNGITQQLEEDKTFLGTFVIAIGFVDFHFFPRFEDGARSRVRPKLPCLLHDQP
jgi:hypothetical protein